jgi:UPF0271 protein
MGSMVDLVADLGESFGAYRMGDDEALLGIVSSANVACGFHAGDPRVMDSTVRGCVARDVGVGAHPGFPDLVGFGRRALEMSPDEVRTDVLYQVGALSAFTAAHGAQLRHVTPHGRLGNLVVTNELYAEAVADAVHAFDPSLIIMVQEGVLAAHARAKGLPVAIMGLADRAYNDDGTLVPRSELGAVIHDPHEVAERVVRMVTDGVVRSNNGRDIPVECDSVLLHGDTPGAVQLARTVRDELCAASVDIRPLVEVLAAKSPDRAVQ